MCSRLKPSKKNMCDRKSLPRIPLLADKFFYSRRAEKFVAFQGVLIKFHD